MYEEELPVTGMVVAVGGLAFNTWWIAVAGAAVVIVGTALARGNRRMDRMRKGR